MATFADMAADNPNLRAQYDEWREARSANGEDPVDWGAFRDHLLALGAPDPAVAELLRSIQNDLFDVGADLCTPVTAEPEFPPLRITAAYTERLEAACDEYNDRLPKLTSFILPGGTAAAALLHQARVVARRAERSVWALLAVEADRTNAETARYLNRLSDLLFILARTANPGGDILWEPGAHSGAHAQ